MTNEEILKRLQELQVLLPSDIDDKALSAEIISIEDEIEQEDSNLQNLIARIDNAKKLIVQYNNDYEDTLADIAETNYRSGIVNSEIDATNYLISEGERELGEFLKALNDDNAPTLKSKIDATKAAIADLREYGRNLESERGSLIANLDAYHSRLNTLPSKQDMLNKTLERLNESVATATDSVEKSKKGLTTKTELQNDSENLLAGYNAEFMSLIGYVKDNRIDSDSVLAKLEELQVAYPMSKNREKTDVEQERKEIKVSIKKYEKEAKLLRKKIADEENYILAYSNHASLETDIVDLKNTIADYESRIVSNEADIKEKKNQIDTLKDRRKNLDQKISQISSSIITMTLLLQQSKKAGQPKTAKDLERQMKVTSQKKILASHKLEAEQLLEEQVLIENSLHASYMTAKQYANQQGRYAKLLDIKKQNFENVSEVDVYARMLDERKLADYEAGIEALKNRSKFIQIDFDVELEKLIKVLNKNKAKDNDENSGPKLAIFKKAGEAIKKKIADQKFMKKFKQTAASIALTGAMIAGAISGCSTPQKQTEAPENTDNNPSLTDEIPDLLGDLNLRFGGKDLNISYDEPEEEIIEEETSIKEEVVDPQVVEKLAWEAIKGIWGNGQERKDNLANAGYGEKTIEAVQKRVNEILKQTHTNTTTATKPSEDTKKEEDAPTTEAPPVGIPPVDNTVTPPTTETEPPFTIVIPPNPGTIPPSYVDKNPGSSTPSQPSNPDPGNPGTSTGGEVDYTVGQGDTLIVETDKGTVTVDNSDGTNAGLLPEGSTGNWSPSDAISGVTYDDKDGSMDVTVDTGHTSNTGKDSTSISSEDQAEYEAIVEEMRQR